MEEKKRCKFDIVAFLAVLILIAFIGCMCVAVVFGIKQQKNLLNVAYADSTNGVVEDNLCLFNDLTELSVNFSSTGSSSFVVPWESDTQNIRAGYNRGSSLIDNVFSSTTLQNGTWATFAYRFLNLPIGTYTATYKVSSIQGYARMTVAGFGNSSFNNYGLCSITFTTSSIGNRDLQVQIQSNSSVTIEWVKLELGSSFTGYVPKDYTNYGYNQGLQYGLDNSIDLQGYTRIGSRSDLGDGGQFVLAGASYTYGTYTEDTNSLYGYNSPNFFVYDSLDGAPNGAQIGFHFVSELSYGNILITVPVADEYFCVVFQDTITGELLYINKYDSLHWKSVGRNGVISGTWVSEWVNITFFSPNVQNIYFISNMFRSTDSAWNENPFYFVGDTPLFAIYSTQSLTALSSFDEGYQKGVKDGADSAVQGNAQSVANARAVGYEQGRRDALADGNDYTFMGLFGAVFDAPIKSFQGLLNFDVLGVNMQSFVLALLSLSVIIIIIKIALGGK